VAEGGHALFVVERTDPGVTVGAEEHKLGLRGSSTVTVHFDGVHLPADRRITGGQGMEGVADALAYGRTALSAGCVGTARAALDAIVRHVRVRRQFGRPLLASPVVQAQVSSAAAQVFAMEALVRAAARESSTLETDSIAAKIACSEGAWSVADLAVQLHGGSGYIEDTGVALLLRDARVTRIFEGANDVLLSRLGLAWAVRRPAWPGGDDSVFATSARELWTKVLDHAQDLARTHGVRIALRPLELHQLGTEAVVAQTVAAVADQAALAPELAAAVLDHARRQVLHLEPGSLVVDRPRHIALQLAEVTP
jgi:acyl-CoA dehydrogenase